MKRWLLLLLPLALLGGLSGMVHKKIQEKKQVEAEGKAQREARKKMPVTVTLAAAEVRDVVRSFESAATVEAPLNVKLAPQMTARILSISAREGDRVRQGQVLVRLDDSELQTQLLQRQAQLAEERQKLAQAQFSEEPTDVQVTSDIRQQEANLDTAKARYAQAVESDKSQMAAAQASVSEMQTRVNSADAAIENAQAAMRSAQANLDNARSAFKRIDGLYKQGYIAAQDTDNARTTVSVQQAALEVAQGQLKSAKAAREGALQQKESAQQQLDTTRSKGRADVEAARAAMSQAQATLAVAKANTVRKPAFRRSLAVQQASIDAAVASVANAKALLANTIIRSPIDGFVTSRAMDPGAMGSPGQPILTLQAINQVWVNVPVPEEVAHSIHFGQEGSVTFDALPGRTFTGKVSQIVTAADPATRQFPVRITLDNRDSAIKPGMFARVVLETQRAPHAVVVPPEAILSRGDNTLVVVIDPTPVAPDLGPGGGPNSSGGPGAGEGRRGDGAKPAGGAGPAGQGGPAGGAGPAGGGRRGPSFVAHLRPVKTGIADTHGIVITEGLQAGEKVVIMSALPVKDGQLVAEAGQGGRGGSQSAEGGPSGTAAGGGEGHPGAGGWGGKGGFGAGKPGGEGRPGGAGEGRGGPGNPAAGMPGGEGRPGADASESPAGTSGPAGGRGERGGAGHPRGGAQSEGMNGKS